MRVVALTVSLIVVLTLVLLAVRKWEEDVQDERTAQRSLSVPTDAIDVRYWREPRTLLDLWVKRGAKYRLPPGESPGKPLKEHADRVGSGQYRQSRYRYWRPVDYSHVVTYDPATGIYEVEYSP